MTRPNVRRHGGACPHRAVFTTSSRTILETPPPGSSRRGDVPVTDSPRRPRSRATLRPRELLFLLPIAMGPIDILANPDDRRRLARGSDSCHRAGWHSHSGTPLREVRRQPVRSQHVAARAAAPHRAADKGPPSIPRSGPLTESLEGKLRLTQCWACDARNG